MKRSPLFYAGSLLAASNFILLIFAWQFISADSMQHQPMLQPSAYPRAISLALERFNRVAREIDPATAHLFILSQADVRTPVKAPENTSMTEPPLRLVGVIIQKADGEPVALIEYGAPARIVRLHSKEKLVPLGWYVENISNSSVKLLKGDRYILLNLDQ